MPRTTLAAIQQLKGQRKIALMTAYDFSLAQIVERAGADMLLVGDSAGKYALGGANIEVTMDEMVLMTRSVSRAARRAPVVGDMPFLSYHISAEQAIANAGRFIKEARADAVKVEGGEDVAPTIRAIVRAGIPVMGHRTYPADAGFDVDDIRRDALALQAAGVFAIMLTGVPPHFAKELTSELRIPTLAGDAAANDCDGAVCVSHNTLGLRIEEVDEPRAPYGPLAVPIFEVAQTYVDDVHAGRPIRATRKTAPVNSVT